MKKSKEKIERAQWYITTKTAKTIVSIPCTCGKGCGSLLPEFLALNGYLYYLVATLYPVVTLKPVDLKFLIKGLDEKSVKQAVKKYISFVKHYTKDRGDCLAIRIAEHLARL